MHILLLRVVTTDLNCEWPAGNQLMTWPAVLIHGVQFHRDLMFVLVEQQNSVAVLAVSRSRDAQFVAKAIMMIAGPGNLRDFSPPGRNGGPPTSVLFGRKRRKRKSPRAIAPIVNAVLMQRAKVDVTADHDSLGRCYGA